MKDTPPVSDAEMTRVLAVEGMGWMLDISGWYWLSPEKHTRVHNGPFDPFTSADDMLLLIDAMTKKGWVIAQHHFSLNGKQIHICKLAQYICGAYEKTADTAQRAVAKAAYQALTGE